MTQVNRYAASIITTNIRGLRDPFVLLVDGVYYAYGTGWICYRNDSGNLSNGWTSLGQVVIDPPDTRDNRWAPEVHVYRGAYYMFTTYLSAKTGRRGCTILRAERPEGPFCEITGGTITPPDWDAIDGTLYIDEDGQPWMVFVHEWVSMPDKVGTFAIARLSDDLTHFVSQPIEIFRADDVPWSRSGVTDGCFLYKTADRQLLMLWSSHGDSGYCVAIARSQSGSIEGPWTHDEALLFSRHHTGQYDGGHGMLFRAVNGQMYLAVHSPNSAGEGRAETPVFAPMREEDGTLVWDI